MIIGNLIKLVISTYQFKILIFGTYIFSEGSNEMYVLHFIIFNSVFQ